LNTAKEKFSNLDTNLILPISFVAVQTKNKQLFVKSATKENRRGKNIFKNLLETLKTLKS